jgi:hypothetical protein
MDSSKMMKGDEVKRKNKRFDEQPFSSPIKGFSTSKNFRALEWSVYLLSQSRVLELTS